MRVTAIAILSGLVLTACATRDPLFCDENTPCEDPALPFCDLEAEYPASEGVRKTCIPDPFDTGNPDAGTTDGGVTDAPVADAVFPDGQRFYVVSKSHHRVMVWNGWPTQNNQPADYVIGQLNFETANANAGGAGPNAIGMDQPRAVTVGDDAVFVADSQNRRVLVYSPIPTTSDATASAVLGQPDFTSGVAGLGPDRLGAPGGLLIVGNALFVSDWENHRVLRYDFLP